MKLKFRRPSNGTTIAMLALFVALTSTAYAASLPKNSVGNKQLKKNAVTSAKIKTSGVLSSDVKNDALTGSDINESTLATVPSATTATTAQSAQSINGANIVKINYRGEDGAGLTDVFNAGGLTLRASCIAGTPALTATTSTDNAMLHSAITTFDDVTATDEGVVSGYEEQDDFDIGDNVNLMTASNTPPASLTDSTQASLTYVNAAGNVVTITYLVEEDTNALGGAGDCIIVGNASVS